MSKIPLYNCYWCKCAWCVKSWRCTKKNCYWCQVRDKKGRLPELKTYCNEFVQEDDYTYKLVREIQRCDNCKYKKLFIDLLDKLEEK